MLPVGDGGGRGGRALHKKEAKRRPEKKEKLRRQ